ncbi:CU044_2847 family protein [Dankookia rubra]|nr:CU044_2847 family protein [Dankookia rubra]
MQFQDLSAKPEQVSFEFGLKFTADALIARTSLESNIKVTLTWKFGAG